MTVEKILIHEAIGETRVVAFASNGRAIALFQERLVEADKRLRWGQTLEGRITKLARESGGAFVEMENGAAAFLSVKDLTGHVEGARGLYRVEAEARTGKLARVAKADTAIAKSAMSIWQENLPGGQNIQPVRSLEFAAEIDEAFEDALNPVATIPGGGVLRFSQTPALLAVDVDTAGRVDRGRATARAKAVNIAAAEELAWQLALRGEGGAVVLDCIAPLVRRDGPDVKAAFLKTYKTISTNRAECLNPSPFGLMEAVIERRAQPVWDAYHEAEGKRNALAEMLKGLRDVEREAIANPTSQLRLDLPDASFSAFKPHRELYEAALSERFGARIGVEQSTQNKVEVYTL